MVRQLPCKPRHFSDLFEEFGSGSIARLPKHQNGGLEVHYIAKGHLHWEIEGRPFLVPPHSAFFTFPWEKHGSLGDFEPGHFFNFAVFRLKASQLSPSKKPRLVPGFGIPEEEQREIFSRLLAARTRCFAATPDFAWLHTRLVRELHHPGAMGRREVIALSQAVLCELVRNLQVASQNPALSASARQVLKFVDDLRDDCPQPWTLESMAAACNLKRTQFETLIKELTGDTPLLLLNRFRVRHAQRALKAGEKSITDIAFDAGFDSSQYFSRIFQKLTGMTPSDYRRNQGNFTAYDQRFLQALNRLRR